LARTTGLINGLELDFVSQNGVEEILKQAENKQLKLLFLHNVDDDIDFSKLENCFVVYIGTNGDKAVKVADIILPSANFAEKDSFYINLEGRIQNTRRVIFAPNLAKLDCEIISELANALGFDLGYKNSEELINLLDQEINLFDRLNSVNKPDNDCLKSSNDNFKFNNNNKIIIKNYDYYLTNSIARSSRILHKCSLENQ